MPLFDVKEDSHWKAFLYASTIVAVTTGFTLEWRMMNPLNLYTNAILPDQKNSFADVIQTGIVAGITTFIVLITFWYLFGLGKAQINLEK